MMQKRFSVLLVLTLLGLLIFPVRAQDPLTKTVVAGTSDFPYTFKYPADWGEPQKKFANTQIDNADGSIHASISYPFTEGSPKAALEDYATNYPNKGDIKTFTVDGRDAARLDGPIANRWQILMVVNDGHTNGLITFEGSKAILTKAEPTLLAIAASLHAVSDSDSAAPTATAAPSDSSAQGTAQELTQTVNAPDGSYSLMYPEGWSAAFEEGGHNIIISSPDKSVIGNAAFEDSARTAKEQADSYITGSNVTDTNISIKEFQVNGLPAARAQFKAGEYTEEFITVGYPNGKLFRIAVYEETPDAIANTGATLLAMASSLKLKTAAPTATAAPADSSAPADQGTAQELTQTVSATDGSFSLMSPAGWQWTPTPPNYLLLSGTGDADSVTAQVIAAPTKTGITPETAIQSFGGKVTSVQINGQEVFYAEQSGQGLIAAVALPDQLVAGIFQGSDAAIKKQEATLLAVMGSVKSGTGSSSAPAGATPVEATTEAVSAPVAADLGEGAILAIVDGQVGGSTGMGNELYELNIDTKTGKSLKQFGTTSSGQFTSVAWSPDGSQLAFYSIQPPGLMITDVNGGNPTVLQQSSFVFAWAPDGKHITNAIPNGGDATVSSLGLDGGRSDFSLTLKAMKYIDFLRWSPDGKWLAYVGTPGDNNDNQDALHIIDATGGNDQLIVPAGGGDLAHNVMWSADSTQLAYIKSDNLTTYTIDTKATQVIAKQVLAADWSPDGKQFAYTTRNAQLFVANADGTKPKEIAIPADLKGQVVSIAWRPGTSSAATPAEDATSIPSPTTTTSTTGAASTCTVSAASGANLRSGPGTSFARAGSLAAGTSQTVIGQAKSSDNFVWWKLENGSWVRSDVVQTAGDCSAVPTVTA